MKEWVRAPEPKLAKGSHQADPFLVVGPKHGTVVWHGIRLAAAGRHYLEQLGRPLRGQLS